MTIHIAHCNNYLHNVKDGLCWRVQLLAAREEKLDYGETST